MAFVAVLGLVAVGLFYVDRRDQERARDICGLINITDDSYREHPAAGAGGQAFAKAVHAYRLRLGCANSPAPAAQPTK